MLMRADARHIPLRDKTVQCCVTSPPYWGLRDYKVDGQIGLERTPEEYVASILAVMREVWRVLRDDGTLWLNLGSSYAGSGDGGGGNRKNEKSWFHDRPTQNISSSTAYKPKDLIAVPWLVALELQRQGWYLRSDIVWSKPNPMPESVTDRPTKAHEYIFLLSKSERYYFDAAAIKEAANYPDGPNAPGSIKSPYGQGFTRKAGGPFGLGGRAVGRLRNDSGRERPFNNGLRNIRSVWEIATQPYSGAHFATFPREIPERCIKAGSKPGGVVLDPFCGSGTTVMVARDLGRIGIGLDLTYQELAAQRVGGSLFAKVVNSAWGDL